VVNSVSYLGVLNSHCSLVVSSVVTGGVILASNPWFSSGFLGGLLILCRDVCNAASSGRPDFMH